MGRAVLLRHELPDGSAHFDWMVQRSPGESLITFRVSVRIDLAGVRVFAATRLAEHRGSYLDYEGPVSDGRGEVTRVAVGELEVEEDAAGVFVCRGWLGGVSGVFTGRGGPKGWEFEVETA